MAEINTWRVACQDAGDGSGDAIVELPSELLEKLGWALGDELTIERVDGVLSLKLKARPIESTG